MITTRILAGCVALIGCATGPAVQAQTADQVGALTDFVNSSTADTPLQRQAAYAVQGMCRALGTAGPLGSGGGLNLLDGADGRRDLFLRCNELVQTATQIQGGSTSRSLNVGDSDLLAAVQQISGEELAAQGALSTQVSAGQFANIGGRLSALRFGSAAAAARGRVAALGPPSQAPGVRQSYAGLADGGHALGGGAAADADGPQVRKPWGWFLESSYGFGDKEQTPSEDAFDFDSYSVTTGTDYNLGNGVLGFAVGYDSYTADFENGLLVSGGDVKVDGVSGSLFGAWFGGGGWSLNGIGTYGKLESDVTRNAVYASNNPACNPICGASRSFTGSPDGSYVALGATLAYDFSAGGWQISPSLSASYRDVDIDGYDETDSVVNGGLALRYDDQSIESKRSIVGLALARPISTTFGVLTPNFRAEWHHEFDSDPRALRAKYVVEDQLSNGSAAQDFNCSISCFNFLTDEVEADYGIAGVGLTAVFAQRVQLYLYYEALLGIGDLTANSLALGIRGQF